MTTFAISYNIVDGYAGFAVRQENSNMAAFLKNSSEGILRIVVSSATELEEAFSFNKGTAKDTNMHLRNVYGSLVDVRKNPLQKVVRNERLAGLIWSLMEKESPTMEVVPASRMALDASDPVFVENTTDHEDDSEESGENTEIAAENSAPVSADPLTEGELQIAIQNKMTELQTAIFGSQGNPRHIQKELSDLTMRLDNVRREALRLAEEAKRNEEYAREEERRDRERRIAIASLATVANALHHSTVYAVESGEVDIAHLESLQVEITAHMKTIKAIKPSAVKAGKKSSGIKAHTGTGSAHNTYREDKLPPGEAKRRILDAFMRPNGVHPDEMGEILGWRDENGQIITCRTFSVATIKKEGFYLLKVWAMRNGKQMIHLKAVTKEEIEHHGWETDWHKKEVVKPVYENYFDETSAIAAE